MMSLCCALLLFSAGPPEPSKKPNIVIILADDQGWGDLSLHGNKGLSTPHLDALALEGARFDRFFVQPVCAPTRAELLTGRWHMRCGVTGVSTGQERLNLDEKTIADAFKASGYATGCFGKWHNGSQYPYHPNGRGFQEFYGFTHGHWGDYFSPPLDHNGSDVQGKGYLAEDLTDRAIEFLKKNAEERKRSFCYIAYNTPHSPMQVPDKYWKKFAKADIKQKGLGKEDIDHTRAALAMCENIDENVGRVLEALQKLDIDKETIVVYFSDNGPNGPRWNGGMKGHKGSTDEGGVRSPLFICWPGRIKADTEVLPVAAAIDLYPTLVELAGIERVGDKPFDGISLAPWLVGKGAPTPTRYLYHYWGGKLSVRDQRFRLDPVGHLYDLTKDPGQLREASALHPYDRRRLEDAKRKFLNKVIAEISKEDDRPFPVGHEEMARSVLPARDGVGEDGVYRSAAAPNCSYFTNWRDRSGRMKWKVEVLTEGRYEAILHYSCYKEDVGSEVELTLGEAKWSGTIKEPQEAPLRGKENDRVPRKGESYMKEFKPLSLGEVELKAGTGTLSLRATKVAGRRVGDVWAVELVRKDGEKEP